MDKKTRRIISRVVGLALLAALLFVTNQFGQQDNNEPAFETLPNDLIEVHFIDVGQGDAILVETGTASLLIDAGETNKGQVVVDYLKSQNIQELDYVIGTHPHSDHIGGLYTVINTIPIHSIIMPAVTHTTKTFEDIIDAIEDKKLKLTKPEVGDEYQLGPASFTIIAPNSSEYDDLNNYSIGIKLTYGSTSFIMAGDAEGISEKEMLANGIDLTADVLKLSHHGSSYSSTPDFLDTVNPSYAVICAGADNEYGHPHTETLQAMKERGINVYRTDKQGTVVFTSNGKTISVNTDKYTITSEDLEN